MAAAADLRLVSAAEDMPAASASAERTVTGRELRRSICRSSSETLCGS
jgi:hypothetical protein